MGSSFENQIEQEQASRREEIINMLIALNQLLYSMQRRLHNDYDSDSFAGSNAGFWGFDWLLKQVSLKTLVCLQKQYLLTVFFSQWST